MNFEAFTRSNERSAWVFEPGIKLLVRRSFIRGHGDYELANMQARRPGEGSLTRFLDKWESNYQFYVENVNTKGLKNYFVRRGYKVLHNARPFTPDNLLGPDPTKKGTPNDRMVKATTRT